MERVGNFPDRLENLYFAYMVDLQAIKKIAPYLEKYNYCGIDQKETEEIKVRF